jgi:hypothetical protein
MQPPLKRNPDIAERDKPVAGVSCDKGNPHLASSN